VAELATGRELPTNPAVMPMAVAPAALASLVAITDNEGDNK
jgi:hypothetical protein